ncbi:MAG: hypothetical protein NVSMB3_07870 [Acidobacteriaceae bacterium]
MSLPAGQVVLGAPVVPGRLEKAKLWVEILQGVSTILALCAALIWFVWGRSSKPQVKIEQTVTQRQVAGDAKRWLLSVDVRATNVGKVKVDLQPGEMELMQINPKATPARMLGPQLSLQALTLEPGESDQALFQDFTLPESIKTIQIHARYRIPGSDKYWNLLSFVDVGTNAGAKETATSVH